MSATRVVAAIIVVITLAVIVSGRAPAVLCLVCALVVAGFLGTPKPSELFAGLSNGGVITVAAMLVDRAKGRVLHRGGLAGDVPVAVRGGFGPGDPGPADPLGGGCCPD